MLTEDEQGRPLVTVDTSGSNVLPAGERNGFLGSTFHRLWPIILGVYWLNALVVAMSYQFVNALLFTLAGMLAAQRRRRNMVPAC